MSHFSYASEGWIFGHAGTSHVIHDIQSCKETMPSYQGMILPMSTMQNRLLKQTKGAPTEQICPFPGVFKQASLHLQSWTKTHLTVAPAMNEIASTTSTLQRVYIHVVNEIFEVVMREPEDEPPPPYYQCIRPPMTMYVALNMIRRSVVLEIFLAHFSISSLKSHFSSFYSNTCVYQQPCQGLLRDNPGQCGVRHKCLVLVSFVMFNLYCEWPNVCWQ